MTFNRFIYGILTLVIVIGSYFSHSLNNQKNAQVAPNLELPMFSGKSLENTTYTEEGVRSYAIQSSQLDHYAKSGSTVFQNPVLIVYKDGSSIEWKVSANTAILDKHQVLTLSERVLMENLLPEANFDTMATEKMVIDLTNRDFKAEQQVMLVGSTFETNGGAMYGNLGTYLATLTDEVQGRYETFTP